MRACRLQSIRAGHRWPGLLCGLLVLGGLLTLGGCGDSRTKPVSLNKQLAQDSFKAFLDAWQAGEQQAALKQRSPSIIASDPDWEAGAKLISYKLLDTEKDDGSNLHPMAELVLQTAEGRQPPASITYTVGTDPVITVFRKN